MKVSFKVKQNSAGGMAVVLPERRVKENLVRLEHQRDEAGSKDEAAAYQSVIDKTLSLYKWASRSEGWEERTFEINRYTTGQKNKARSEATNWDSGVPRVDEVAFWRSLAIVSTGLSPSEFDDLHPALSDALVDELRALMEPSLEQIRFFDMQPTCWPQPEP